MLYYVNLTLEVGSKPQWQRISVQMTMTYARLCGFENFKYSFLNNTIRGDTTIAF